MAWRRPQATLVPLIDSLGIRASGPVMISSTMNESPCHLLPAMMVDVHISDRRTRTLRLRGSSRWTRSDAIASIIFLHLLFISAVISANSVSRIASPFLCCSGLIVNRWTTRAGAPYFHETDAYSGDCSSLSTIRPASRSSTTITCESPFRRSSCKISSIG